MSHHAQFRVIDGFQLSSRRAWVLCGDIVAGKVRAGMYICFPFNEKTFMTAPIRSVEFVDSVGESSHVGLVLDCDDEIARAFWEGFTSPGELLAVTDHDPAA